MYGVLIVDDEKYVRLWLRNCIQWADYGFDIIGEANNGYDALVKIGELKPRLVISDMDMPEIDGVGLIEKANELYPEVLFLILSGYNAFEYMRSAVKNNAVDYLLKPVNEEEIIPVVKKIQSRLELEDKKKEVELRTKILIKENLELRREKFFLNLLDEQAFTLQEATEKVEELGIQNDGDFYNVLIISFDEEILKGQPTNVMGVELLKFSMINIANEVFSTNNMSSCFLSRKNEVIGVVNFATQDDDVYQRIVDLSGLILNNINGFLKLSISIGIGSVVKDITCIGASYTEAKRSLDLRLLYGDNSVLTFLNVPSNFKREVLSVADENRFTNSIAGLDYSSCRDIITEIFHKMRKSGIISIETIKMVYYRLISVILREIYNAGITPSYLSIEEMEMFTAIKNLNSIEQIRDKLMSFLEKALEGISNTQKIKNSAVEKAIGFITENYYREITLTDISNHVHVTPNYFSALFKAETGQNVLDYITNLRIEKVKSLMKDKSLKTYEIGEMVGYKSPKYFCRVFKKILGQSPSQYRKALVKNPGGRSNGKS